MAELKTLDGGYALWLYLPSTVAAALFTALFALGTAAVTWRMFKAKAWFCVVFVIGGLFQVVGYAARAASRDKTDQLLPYIIQSVFILVAPALFAASVYMTLGRIITSIHAEELSIIRVSRLTKLFVAGDVISFVVQSGGASLMAIGNNMKTGEYVVLGGLFVQIIVFGLYVVTSAIFHRRVNKLRPRTTATYGNQWEQLLTMLYIVSALIMVRSVFRVIEYIMGHDGYLLANEWTLYVFDALLMFVAVAVFAWRFPGSIKTKGADLELSSEEQFDQSSAGEDIRLGATTNGGREHKYN